MFIYANKNKLLYKIICFLTSTNFKLYFQIKQNIFNKNQIKRMNFY